MKKYRVYYIIKMDRIANEYYLDVEAKNQKEAIKQVREKVFKETGRNAFTPTAYHHTIGAEEGSIASEGLPPKKAGR